MKLEKSEFENRLQHLAESGEIWCWAQLLDSDPIAVVLDPLFWTDFNVTTVRPPQPLSVDPDALLR